MVSLALKRGLSFMEIIVVIAIMAIFAVAVGPKLLSLLTKASKSTTEANLRVVKQAVNSYYADTGQYPESLSDLMRRPFDEKIAKRWEGPYLDSDNEEYIRLDGWKHELQYRRTESGPKPYELWSFGAGGEDSSDETWVYA